MRLNLLKNFYGNHVFASLCLALVIAMGGASYLSMPVEQNPSVNFNWVLVITPYPGAAPTDIEKSITTPVEDALRKLSDVRFVRSTSRDSLSTVLLRFRQISSDEYDDHMVDLRRELQTIKQDLPHEAQEPQIIEVTSSNSVPSATIVLVGPSDGTHLREYAKKITEDIERMPEVEDLSLIHI